MKEKWFFLEELCDYLPERPSKSTIYSWVGKNMIPFHKRGKRLLFLQSEIDSWYFGDLLTQKNKNYE